MIKVETVSDLLRHSGPILDAAQAAPVIITRKGKDDLALINVKELARLQAVAEAWDQRYPKQ